MLKMFFAIWIGLLILAQPVYAHKVIASAWTDGNDIEGEVGLSNGDMALKGTLVEIFDEEGNKLGETQILEDGLFRFTPEKAVTHKVVANLGAGHVAQLTIGVDELPENLKGTPSGTAISRNSQPQTTQISSATLDIETLVAKAVRKEVQPLRKEIALYKEKNNLQNILGGIGYIFGIFGIGFYLAARKKESQGK